MKHRPAPAGTETYVLVRFISCIGRPRLVPGMYLSIRGTHEYLHAWNRNNCSIWLKKKDSGPKQVRVRVYIYLFCNVCTSIMFDFRQYIVSYIHVPFRHESNPPTYWVLVLMVVSPPVPQWSLPLILWANKCATFSSWRLSLTPLWRLLLPHLSPFANPRRCSYLYYY